MLRELIMGLVVVFMASSVIINSIFRSTRSDKPRLPPKNVSSNASVTDKQYNKTPGSESKGSNSKPIDV
ncbi:MAG TPA: hypothetical protein VE548_05245 [Nitrososphaeraceae archaeon]|jgi:hypothetical protein|nr:hypothetical protein [Nitrososphaeraceae archaeon]